MFRFALIASASALIAQGASADVNVRFIEGAPKDRFEITSTSECLTGPVTVAINLEGSAGGLIFDITDQGAGVEVFQPFELTAGGALVATAPTVVDGDTALELGLSALPMGQTVAFTLDVDDTGGAREITVSGAEIAGATVVLKTSDATQSAVFDDNARAQISQSSCSS